MKFPNKDEAVPRGTKPGYDANNPLLRVIHEIEQIALAAGRGHYLADSLQYLYPFRKLTLYRTSDSSEEEQPLYQDNKNDFQKQNIAEFQLGDFYLTRGYAHAGDWTGSFLKICYRGTPGTELGKKTAGDPGPFINAWVKIGGAISNPFLKLPLNPSSGCYETELWSFNGDNLRALLGGKGKAALDAGLIQQRPDLVSGALADFEGPGVDQKRDDLNRSRAPWLTFDEVPNHTMHPIRPLRVELAFASADLSQWDSQGGRNYRVEFDMLLRGWKNFMGCGVSANPHGGVGFLEYRNLLSNYFDYEKRRREVLGGDWRNELGRDLIPGNFDAHTMRVAPLPDEGGPTGVKVTSSKRETFMAVDYMDLHILQPDCGIGIHRHRDNQEAFLMMRGKGLMLVGDWAEFEHRDRAFELRTMKPGDITICKTGQLHALFNSMDEECLLFMFGGYD
ncbi:MAG: hypothetical protein RLZZ399_1798 [Verrucomicrobiota bacterium]|jgi:mannose-6-phosphate isomerase-like protein (cupin superfamily)